MTPSDVFSVANSMAFLMWLLMIVLPKWKATRFLVDLKLIPLLLSVLYLFYLISSIMTGPTMDFGSLKAVMALFTSESAVLAGWLHYLAFDMLVGMWMLEQNKKLNIQIAIMIPVLAATFIMGPVGFILFMGIKTFKKQKDSISLKLET